MSNEAVNIKGTRNGLVICLDASRDFEEIKNNLKSKIESSQGFFKGAKFTFHLDDNSLSNENTKELEQICCQNGLIFDNNISWQDPGSGSGSNVSRLPVNKKQYSPQKEKSLSPSFPTVGLYKEELQPCLFVQRGLRSGQKLRYNGSVVVLGDVNPGSEISAAGDVIVMGTLRGVVHAGFNGNNESVITAYRLNPIQLRIGNTISRPPENNSISNYPETARLKDGQMVIEPYITSGLKQSGS